MSQRYSASPLTDSAHIRRGSLDLGQRHLPKSFLVITVIGATDLKAPVGFAGIPIGLVLVLIHLVGIPVTNTSVNPARSIGPALFVGGWAVQQLWLLILAPLAGALLAAIVYRGFVVPILTTREAERALPTEQEERLRSRGATP